MEIRSEPVWWGSFSRKKPVSADIKYGTKFSVCNQNSATKVTTGISAKVNKFIERLSDLFSQKTTASSPRWWMWTYMIIKRIALPPLDPLEVPLPSQRRLLRIRCRSLCANNCWRHRMYPQGKQAALSFVHRFTGCACWTGILTITC